MGLVISAVSFLAALLAARRSLPAGLTTLLAVGYFYGIARARFPDGYSHFAFDAALLGLYLGHFARGLDAAAAQRSRDAVLWAWLLALVPIVMFLVPLQDSGVQLVGLRAAVLFLPLLVLGARLRAEELDRLAAGVAVLNLVAFAFGSAEYLLGVPPFYPRNDVTRLVYLSNDVGPMRALRIPATFTSAHAFAGTMVATVPFLVGWWNATPRRGARPLALGSLLATALAIFLSGTRSAVVLLLAMAAATVLAGRLSGKRKVVLALAAVALAVVIGSNERLQRFLTLSDTSYVGERVRGSANMKLLDIAREYPLGAGLARAAGTSIPFFLQAEAAPQIGLENEFSRIVIEEGLVGLALWLACVLWTVLHSPRGANGRQRLGRDLMRVYVLLIWASGLVGTGLLTSIPATALTMVQMGLLMAAAAAAPLPAARPAVDSLVER